MAPKSPVERLSAFIGGRAKSLPFLKRRLPGLGHSSEPFDSLEDGTTVVHDDFEPNAALDLSSGAKGKKKGGGVEALTEGFKSALDTLLQSRLLLGLAAGLLLFLLALALVALVVNAPPRPSTGKAKASSASSLVVSPDGAAILRRLILPKTPDNAPQVELERETSKVYTVEDLAAFSTDPASVDISGLLEANGATIQALYGTVP